MRGGRGARPGSAAAAVLRAAVLAACLTAAGFAASCSFDYGQALAEDLAERTPDAVFTNFSHTVVQDNSPVLRIEAASAEFFDKKNLVRLSAVTFTELRAGRVLAFGSADGAVLRTDTEDAEFFGTVNLRSEEEGVSIRTGYLSWNASDRVLSGDPDGEAEIRRDDGSFLRGSGFRADARRKGISFGGGVEGLLVREKDPAGETGETGTPGPAGGEAGE